jgi:hypothetical protein
MRDRLSYMYIGIPLKYPVLLAHFNETSFISADFRKTIKYQIS